MLARCNLPPPLMRSLPACSPVLHTLSADDTIRYDQRCYFNVRSKANMSQLNLPHGPTTKKCKNRKKTKSRKQICPEITVNIFRASAHSPPSSVTRRSDAAFCKTTMETCFPQISRIVRSFFRPYTSYCRSSIGYSIDCVIYTIENTLATVSYTHLTLPTIYSV